MGIAFAFLLPRFTLSELRRTESLSSFGGRGRSSSYGGQAAPPSCALRAQTTPPFLGFLNSEFNGIGGLRAHIGIVPICGTLSLYTSAPASPWLGPFLLDLEVSAGSAFRRKADIRRNAEVCQVGTRSANAKLVEQRPRRFGSAVWCPSVSRS